MHKNNIHNNNIHNNNYNFDALINTYTLLKDFVFINKFNTKTIDFSNPKAVKVLNTALIKNHYNINYWKFSDENLCPPIPSRVDYIHHLNDLIEPSKNIKVLDIGTGASLIYPLLGNAIYNWKFIATDIDIKSIENAQEIISKNKLEKNINLRLQSNKKNILNGIILADDYFNVSMCNPPFYKSEEEALKATSRKLKNLNITTKERNFSGNANELLYNGGEKAFLHNYIFQSKQYKEQCEWFTSLVSKKELLKDLKRSLKKLNAKDIKVINMEQGNKISRILAWRFK